MALRKSPETVSSRPRNISAETNPWARTKNPLWRIIFLLLFETPGQSLFVGEICNRLKADGHELGRYPMRTISATVASQRLTHLFILESHKDDPSLSRVSLTAGRTLSDLV